MKIIKNFNDFKSTNESQINEDVENLDEFREAIQDCRFNLPDKKEEAEKWFQCVLQKKEMLGEKKKSKFSKKDMIDKDITSGEDCDCEKSLKKVSRKVSKIKRGPITESKAPESKEEAARQAEEWLQKEWNKRRGPGSRRNRRITEE